MNIVATKLRPAFLPVRSLARERLLEPLQSEPAQRLTLVVGSPGAGKTSLLADLMIRSHGAWVDLGPEDSDPNCFIALMLESIHRSYPDAIPKAYAAFRQDQAPEVILKPLINELCQYAGSVRVILDEFHLVSQSDQVCDFLKYLLGRAPANFSLIIGTRSYPDLPLANLRSKGQLGIINQLQLAFSKDEADRLFREVWDFSLSPAVLEMLLKKTDGWVTGLQLASLALKPMAPDQRQHYIQQLHGGERDIHDYLAQEVFGSLESDMQDFLLATCGLDGFSLPEAAKLYPKGDTWGMVEKLRKNLQFLHEDRDQYRYHPLLREFLQHRVHRAVKAALPSNGLEPRQDKVLHLLGQGKTNQEIADALFLSVSSVKTIVKGLFDHFKVQDRTHLAAVAVSLANAE